MATTATPKSGNTSHAARGPKARAAKARSTNRSRPAATPGILPWVGVVASVVGAGLVAGYYASQKGWFTRVAEWSENHAAAFADGETDEDNFDQTRSAGIGAMRDDHDDWDDVDDISDASFPASDPPSFNPGTA